MQSSFDLSFLPKRESSNDSQAAAPGSSQAHGQRQNSGLNVALPDHTYPGLPHRHTDTVSQVGEDGKDDLADWLKSDLAGGLADDLTDGYGVPINEWKNLNRAKDKHLNDDADEVRLEEFWESLCTDYGLDLDAINLIRELFPDPSIHPLDCEDADWLERAIFGEEDDDGLSMMGHETHLLTDTALFIDARDATRWKRAAEYEALLGVEEDRDEWFFEHCDDVYGDSAVMDEDEDEVDAKEERGEKGEDEEDANVVDLD